MFPVFHNMGMHIKMPFYDKYLPKKKRILGYNNRESVAMAVILNKKNSFAGIFGDFSPECLVGIQVTFLKVSAFYIFFHVEP